MGTGFIPSMNSPQMSATLTMPKEANTADKVFLEASIKILDAIEDINLNITI